MSKIYQATFINSKTIKRFIISKKLKWGKDILGNLSAECPYGGAVLSGRSIMFKQGLLFINAKINSLACSDCINFKGEKNGYIKCNRKEMLEYPPMRILYDSDKDSGYFKLEE